MMDELRRFRMTGWARGRRPKRASRLDSSTLTTSPRFRLPSSNAAGTSGVCYLWPGFMGQEVSIGSHAPSARRAEERDGSALRAPDGLGQGRRLSLVRARDGADVGIRVDRRSRRSGLVPGHVCTNTETLYNFQGLRAYKEKFDPVWESRYLVYPGGSRRCTSQPTCPRWSRAAIGGSSRSETHSPSSNSRNSIVSRATLSSISARMVSA